MELRGRMCLLYPFSAQGAAISPTVAYEPVAQSFHAALAAGLAAYGLDVRTPVGSDLPAGAVFVSGQVVKADPGSQLMRWLFTFFAGGAQFEVVGRAGDKAMTVPFRTVGTRRGGAFGGNSVTLLNDAAKLAGQQAAGQIAGILAARP